MDAKKISILSMLAASSCCLPPLILLGLTLIGVSTAGFAGLSSTLGSLKFYLLPLALTGVGLSYWLYFKEKKNCATKACRMANEKFTKIMLTVSTVVVLSFLVLSFYPSALSSRPVSLATENRSENLVIYAIEGMTCGSCELAVDEVIKATGLVDSVKSEYFSSQAYVWFKEKKNNDLITEAVASVGYEAVVLKEKEVNYEN